MVQKISGLIKENCILFSDDRYLVQTKSIGAKYVVALFFYNAKSAPEDIDVVYRVVSDSLEEALENHKLTCTKIQDIVLQQFQQSKIRTSWFDIQALRN